MTGALTVCIRGGSNLIVGEDIQVTFSWREVEDGD